jgi:serine/threonine protein kinase
MILLDITNEINEDDIHSNNYITLKLTNRYDINTHNNFINNPILKDFLQINSSVELKIKICKFLGEGSYGQVYKIKIGNDYFALKINENEKAEKLYNRYTSLTDVEKLRNYVINIYIAGRIKCQKYSYFSIMEYGGKTLKSIINDIKLSHLVHILKQLFNIAIIVSKYKILLTDFKLGNITISSDNRLKIIDLYMDCESYTPCRQCRIVKTYSTIEIETEKRIYEDPDYNFTCIYIPLAISLIDLLCESTASYYFSKLALKYNIPMNIKGMIPLIQIACYNYSNENNESIKKYKNVYSRKKKLEEKFPCIKEPEFYDYFMNLLKPREEYKSFISTKRVLLILNDLFSIDPQQRTLIFLKDKLI